MIGHDTGNIYAVNTLGAMAGSFATAFLFIPYFGLRGTLFYSLEVYVLTGVLIFVSARKRNKKMLAPVLLAVAGSFFMLNVMIPENLFKDIFIKHVSNKNEELLFYKEGVISYLGLFKNGDFYTMRYPDKTFGGAEILSDGIVRTNHRLKAHIPVILHKGPAAVLNIGLGTGISSYALTGYNNIERIDTVEIIAETMQVAGFFIDDADDFFKNPKINIFADDGRNFLFVAQKKYDVILVYPYSPFLSETMYLYTKDFFQLCKSRLNKGGVVSIWLPVRHLGNDASAMLVRTFMEVFPYATFWNTRTGFSFYDVTMGGFLVGAADKGAYSLAPDYLEKRISSSDDTVRSELKSGHIGNASDLLKHCLADSDSLEKFARQAKEIVSDDRTILDYRAAEVAAGNEDSEQQLILR